MNKHPIDPPALNRYIEIAEEMQKRNISIEDVLTAGIETGTIEIGIQEILHLFVVEITMKNGDVHKIAPRGQIHIR